MLERWASTVTRRRWWILIAAIVLAVLAGSASVGLTDRLEQGGYDVPGSESDRAYDEIDRALGQQDADAVAVYTVPAGQTLRDPATVDAVRERFADLPDSEVDRATGWWRLPALLSADGRTAAVSIQLQADEQSDQIASWHGIEDRLAGTEGSAYGVDGLTVRFSGYVAMGAAVNEQTEADLVKAELISFPLLLVLLVLVFRGVVAAGMPLIVGGLGIVGALGVLWLLASLMDVSVFATNVVTLLGLGLAIDYGLFVVSRFREELHARPTYGGDVADALRTTMRTAGRTVMVSGLTVAAALSGLLVFPQMMLRSIGFGGMAAVVVAALAAVTVLPALLAVLGRRIDALRLPFQRKSAAEPYDENKGWGRVGRLVMRRPGLVAAVVIGALLVVGTPFLHVRFADVDASVLPAGNDVRVATEQLRDELPAATDDGARLVVVGTDGNPPTQRAIQELSADANAVDGVDRVDPTDADEDVTLLTARLDHDPQSEAAQQAIRDLRALDEPAGVSQLLVGGPTALLVDTVDSIADRTPWMLAVLAGAILVLLFLAFGSVVLPVKAILLSALSLTASFGALVWIFQDGNLVSLLGTEAGPIEASMPVLMLAVLFGLSTDYELFLLSRVTEGFRAGRSPRDAVVYGLRRTGGLITAAALLLAVVVGAFSLSGVKFMKLIGIGMLIAIAVDATIVRGLLVPSLMALLGRVNWWAPGPLRRLADRFALEPTDNDTDNHFGEQGVGSHTKDADPLGSPNAESSTYFAHREQNVSGLHRR